MNVTSATSSTADIWEEIRQETMRTSQRNIPASAQDSNGQAAAASGTASAATIDPDDTDGDGTVSALEQLKAMQKKAQAASARKKSVPSGTTEATSAPVATPLENVGPNTFERIRANAGRTYMAQAENYDAFSKSSNGGETAASGLFKSA